MSKNLVIVESPAKAKTIEGYLGKDFTVKSSFGHIRDLPKGGLAIDIENGFEPKYEVSADKKKLIAELKKLAKAAEIVWLATDEDREGEAISWHLAEELGLKPERTRRIVFSEITKSAITRAIENPREVDVNLVNAQQARRVLDRLVGFEISPVLWKKVKPSLSAGRVQSVAVRILVEREREIRDFQSSSSFRVVAQLTADGSGFKAELPARLADETTATAFVEGCVNQRFTVDALETKPAKKTPAAPFTTSTLQQEASRKLGFSVTQTMVVAQRLYESGRITYMRTDSTNLSDFAVQAAADAIEKNYGKEYIQTRQYASKSKGAQEAHEAIRPTDMLVNDIGGDRNEQRLYDLIRKRTLASQMADAQLEKTTATIGISNRSENLVARGEVIRFQGFLKVYLEGTDDEDDEGTEGMLPPMREKQELGFVSMTATERFTQHPARYTEASLVRKLEELGIGRPSTYAPTISTIQKRGYVVKEDRTGNERSFRVVTLVEGKVTAQTATEITGAERSKLFPTDIGMVVNDFLLENFPNILDFNFTANVEEEFDSIASGQVEWNDMISRFYGDFHQTVKTAIETSERATGERELGKHPETGKTIIARIGRFGPMVQIGDSDDEEKQFASLLGDQSISTISLEEALDLFKLPRKLGSFEGESVSAAIGRFGPYVRHGKSFVSIKEKEGDDPYTITMERAVELIIAKREADANSTLKTFEEEPDIKVLNGRFGPYIKAGKKNVKIPKDKNAEELTLEEVRELVAKAPDKPARRKTSR